MAKQTDVLLIVPGQGRWVYTSTLRLVEFFEFGENCSSQAKLIAVTKNTRRKALKVALRQELKRQQEKP